MQADKLTVYHPETGEAYTGEPVDARELMNMQGYTTQPPATVVEDVEVAGDSVAMSGQNKLVLTEDLLATYTVAELKEVLNSKEVVYASNALKADLINLVLAG